MTSNTLTYFKSMKKLIYIFLFFILFPFAAHAQWRLGASAGGDYNHYSINTHYQTDYHYSGVWGWNVALFTQYNFRQWLALRAEIEAIEKDYRFYRTGIYSGTNYTTTNTYLQLPVMVSFSFGGQKVRGFVNTGVYAGCWLASKQKGTYYNTLSYETEKVNQAYQFIKQKDQRADFGLVAGIGIEYMPHEHWVVHLETRSYYSFISTVKQYMEINDYRYNTTITLQAGFSYIF